ncbi:MAG TPA: type II toxin-antitoxin system VapC family toxin [Gemmataceae bacterium]|nr:type II toxin-antitoxin system VapC family toxin [Gemmataceae bacterium]
MVILDTDVMTLLEWSASPEAQRLKDRLAMLPVDQVRTTIISFEEQMRGWMSHLASKKKVAEQVKAYAKLRRFLDIYRRLLILDFDERAAVEFVRLKKQLPRLKTMDLKIAAIALSQNVLLISRNLRDFEQVPGLQVEDWTK